MTSRKAAADFADLLRRLRVDAGLSQASLAERAGISVDAVGVYERGLQCAPRRETIARLVDALQLSGTAQEEFEFAARRRRDLASPATNDSVNNLPWQPTSFVGRHREIDEISGLLAPRCLVTITGAGGIGKTRTSLEVASRLLQPPQDGIWFIDLAPLNDGALIVNKIASVLDIQVSDQSDLLAALVTAIKGQRLLLILDNCEHIMNPIRSLAEAVLAGCPQITLLATSRERLGIGGELVYKLSTLPIPAEGVTTAAEGRTSDALELFVERAIAAKHGFQFTDEHVEAASDICRRLDGVALAIELAAARLPLMGLRELRSQLTSHFRVIASSRSDLPARQQTLHSTISWSYDLLSEPERLLFHRLAVFTSGWTLEAATSVCSDDTLQETSVFGALISLAEKSLVQVDIDTETPRYSFFEATRFYALERLTASGESPELFRRHARWMAAYADRAYDQLGVMPPRRWQIAATPELDNTLAAMEWAQGPDGDAVLAGRIASGLWGFWRMAGLGIYGSRYVDACLKRVDAEEHPALVARLLLAQIQFLHGADRADAMKRAISLLDRTSDRRTLARCYGLLASALSRTAMFLDAEEASNKASALVYEAGMQRSSLYSSLLRSRSEIFHMQGRLDEAKAALTEALSLAEALEDDWLIAECQAQLAEIEFATGNVPRAVALGEKALANARRVRSADQPCSLNNLACYQLVLGEVHAAEMNAREAIHLARGSTPDALTMHIAIQHLAAIGALQGKTARAARLLGYVNAWCERIGYPRDPTDLKSYDILMDSLRKQLSESEISALTSQGAQLTEDAAIYETLNT